MECNNTRICYLYRDDCNYKTYREVVIGGLLRIEKVVGFLKDGEFFVPSEVGLLDLQPEVFSCDDHIWHEIEYLEPTGEAASWDLTAEEFLGKCERAHENDWNQSRVFRRKGLI